MLHLRLFFLTFSCKICVREIFTCIFVSFTIVLQFYLTAWYFDSKQFDNSACVSCHILNIYLVLSILGTLFVPL